MIVTLAKPKKHISSQAREKFLAALKDKDRNIYDLDELKQGLKEGNRFVLSKAITLVEKQGSELDPFTIDLLDWAQTRTGNSFRISVSGSSGVGNRCFAR